jgi:hypothetical protein
MNKLSHIAMALANNTLSERAMFHVKGGADNQNSQGQNGLGQNAPLTALLPNVSSIVEDEKRRERPGGGINTN